MSNDNNPTIWDYEEPRILATQDVKVKIVPPDERCITHHIIPNTNEVGIIQRTCKTRSAILKVRKRELFEADDQESRTALISYVGGFRVKRPCRQCEEGPRRFEECRMNMHWPAIPK
ncbi:vacuolar protein sorting/targeting protein PEP1, partial [Ascosphaera pollenicola]